MVAIIQGAVEFDLRSCWDCGLYPMQVLTQILFLAAICMLGAHLAGKGGGILPAHFFGPSRPRTVGLQMSWNF